MSALPAPVIRLFEVQFGVVARCQLLDEVTPGCVSGLVDRGTLVVVERGVYRVRGSAESREQAAMAAVLRSRPQARVTGPFVLGLFGVEGFTRQDPFEVLLAPGRRLTGVAFASRVDPTSGADGAAYGALQIVTPTRALIDSARFVLDGDERALRAAIDDARWRGLTTTDRLRRGVAALGPRDRGAARMARLQAEGALDTESEGERALAPLLDRLAHRVERQVWVTSRIRVDFYVRELRLAFEYLGELDHGHAAGRLADTVRLEELERLGILVVPVVAGDLRDPGRFVTWITSVTRTRASELALA